ncbi:MAG: MFS transporter [Bryobacteraceae bacterium]
MAQSATEAVYSAKEQRAWYMYDFANSAFSSTVVTLFLGPYLTALAKAAADADGMVRPLGIAVDARSYWSYLISLSVLSQVAVLPVVGAWADASRNKKRILGVLAYTGAGATIAMFWLSGGMYLLGGALFLIANLAFGASIVVYNSFLNDIAPPGERDAVSSRGWGIGYLGGGLLLALNLLLYQQAPRLGLDEAMAVRISLGSAGAWWAFFTVIPMAGLKARGAAQAPERAAWKSGFTQLGKTLRSLSRYRQALVFLAAYLLYNDAIQAVITLSGQFGADHLKMPMGELTLAILMVQFVAFGGAMAYQKIAEKFGAYRTVMASLFLWTGLMCGVFFIRDSGDFFLAAALVALIMGGTQALSRSLFSVMIPKGKEAEYFSLYEISDKGTSWLAPLIFGLALQFTGSYEWAVASLIVFFLAGIAVLAQVDVQKGMKEAGQA